MFVCYLDDSDHTQSGVVTLAGYAAALPKWERFEDHSRMIYDKYGIGDILHAKDLHQTKGPFKGWSRSKKLGFVDDLYSGHGLTWGVGVSISKQGFASSKEHPAIGPNLSPLGLAFAFIMHALLRGNPLGGLIQLEGLSFVVESGHRNNGDLDRYFNRNKSHDLYKGFLRGITFGDKLSARALHLADLLAFNVRRHHARELAHGKTLIILKERIFDRICSKVPHYLEVVDPRDLQRMENPTDGDVPWAALPISLAPSRR